jgi:hypothetical protein
MKAINLFTFVFLSTILLASCSKEKTAGSMGSEGILIDESTLTSIDGFFDEIEFIPFLVPEDNPISISGIEPVISFGAQSFIICFDTYNDIKLYEYDYQGKFIRMNDRKGNGPGEIPFVGGFARSYEGNLINIFNGVFFQIFDNDFNEIKRVDARQGEKWMSFLELHALTPDRFLVAVNGIYQNDEESIIKNFGIFDMQSNSLESFDLRTFPITDDLTVGSIRRYRDFFVLNFGASDTLYRYDNEGLRPWVVMNLGKRALPNSKKTIGQEDPAFMQMIEQQTYAFNFGNLESAGDWMAIMIYALKKGETFSIQELQESGERFDMPVYDAYFNPNTGEVKAIKSPFLTEFRPIKSDGNYFYQVLFPEDWAELLESGKLGDRLTSLLQEAADKLNDTEDPILVRWRW